MTRVVVRCVVVVFSLLLVGCSADEDAAPPAETMTSTSPVASTTDAPSSGGDAEPVVREILVEMQDPPGAADRTLTLVRYTIAASARLPAHVHPGVQMAWIESGELTYTVESGTAIVHRAGVEAPELVDGPTVVTLRAGDAVTELGDMVHFGANDTDEPIVILATLLTESGEDLAVVVED